MIATYFWATLYTACSINILNKISHVLETVMLLINKRVTPVQESGNSADAERPRRAEDTPDGTAAECM